MLGVLLRPQLKLDMSITFLIIFIFNYIYLNNFMKYLTRTIIDSRNILNLCSKGTQ